jgi:hypothetical protein
MPTTEKLTKTTFDHGMNGTNNPTKQVKYVPIQQVPTLHSSHRYRAMLDIRSSDIRWICCAVAPSKKT